RSSGHFSHMLSGLLDRDFELVAFWSPYKPLPVVERVLEYIRYVARNGYASSATKPLGVPPPAAPYVVGSRSVGMYRVPNSQSHSTNTPAKFLSSASGSELWCQWWYTGLTRMCFSGPHVHATSVGVTTTNTTTTGTAHSTATGAKPSSTSSTACATRDRTSLTGWNRIDDSQFRCSGLWWTAWNGHSCVVWNSRCVQ